MFRHSRTLLSNGEQYVVSITKNNYQDFADILVRYKVNDKKTEIEEGRLIAGIVKSKIDKHGYLYIGVRGQRIDNQFTRISLDAIYNTRIEKALERQAFVTNGKSEALDERKESAQKEQLKKKEFHSSYYLWLEIVIGAAIFGGSIVLIL